MECLHSLFPQQQVCEHFCGDIVRAGGDTAPQILDEVSTYVWYSMGRLNGALNLPRSCREGHGIMLCLDRTPCGRSNGRLGGRSGTSRCDPLSLARYGTIDSHRQSSVERLRRRGDRGSTRCKLQALSSIIGSPA